MAILKKRLISLLDREIRIYIKEARNLAIPFSKDPSKPLIIYHNGNNEEIVEPIAEARPARSPNVRYNHEGTLHSVFDLRLNIVVKDHGLEIGHCKLGLQKLNRGLRVTNWYPLKPEGQGEILIELVAVNFGKIAKPHRKMVNIPVQLGPEYIITKVPFRNAYADSPKKELIKEYKKTQIKRILPHIAAGHFGIVYKGNVNNHKEIVAIKDIKVTDYTLFEEWKREVEFMSQHKNSFIVKVYGFCCTPKILTIVLEYMEYGSLFDLLHNDEPRLEFNDFDRLRMARQTSLGVAFLHANKILHRDVKSLNILVSKSRVCKLADFGSAKLISLEQLEYYTADVGTPLWMAPEVRHGRAYSLSADVYSLAVVLYEIFENKLPDYDKERMMIVIHSFNFPSGPLISPMLNLNPKQRPSAEFIAKQLNKILQYVIEKGHSIDIESLMTSQNVHTKDVQTASNLVTEGLSLYSKDYLGQNNSEDEETDLVIVDPNNAGDYDYDDSEAEEFEDIDDYYANNNTTHNNNTKRGRGLSLNGSPKVITPSEPLSQPLSPNYRHTQQSLPSLEKLDSPSLPAGEEETKKYRSMSVFTPDNTKEDQCVKTNSSPNGLTTSSVPSSDQIPKSRRGLVLYTFAPENPGELAVQADDVIEVMSIKGEWVECLTIDRRRGWVPFNYVHIQDYLN